ncbi:MULTISPECIES: cell wall metabolism sensor histidine kinase WalK [Thalassospira]|uniref:histidine kinase n=1 Tax=Thalassospira profundimaris TaxID=502049 RepID=A0A367X0P4_9PROT|nr:ATP-binding protein [Thalassospira profundimaris]RCK47218.1 histidine kinase [Thalassospira profundimaris]
MADMFAEFSNYLRRYKPRTLGGRIFLLMMLGGVIIAALSALASYYVIERDERIGRAYTLGFTIRELVRIADNPEFEPNIVDIAARDGMALRILPADDIGTLLLFSRPAQHIAMPVRLANTGWPTSVKVHFMRGRLSSEQRATIEATENPSLFFAELSREIARLGLVAQIEIMMPTGKRILVSHDELWANYSSPSLVFLMFLLGVVAVLAVFAALADLLAGPFKNLTAAIIAHGDEVDGPPVEERGPTEARSMAAAYNDLRERISRMLGDRTRMLAAISHDLRTPSTRLRLRAEFIENDELRETVLRDLDEMDGLLNDALDFLGDWIQKEEERTVDFVSVLEAICDDYADLGRPVSFDGPQPLQFSSVHTVFGGGDEPHSFEGKRSIRITCRPGTLKRAFTNLIENALKYGYRAKVSLEATADNVLVTIRDEGPGIPVEHQDKVFLPFYRVEGSRARSTGGSGLGLSIVKTVIDAHDGKISLRNMPGKGLEVIISLPRRV